MRCLLALILLILYLPHLTFGQSIQKTLEASQQDCTGNKQIVAATFKVFDANIEPIIEHTACANAPVTITRMKVDSNGAVWISFKNLDKERRAVAVGYLVTVFDEQNRQFGAMGTTPDQASRTWCRDGFGEREVT